MDLIVLTKINQNTSVEKFGSEINSSFFDASNILGSLKQKGLIDFTIIFSVQNKIILTDIGKKLIEDANKKALETLDSLDSEILKQLSVSKRNFIDISSTLNIRPLDIAMHLYKLLKQDNISYTIQNANIELLLTESGFIKLKQLLLQQNKQDANDFINQKELGLKNNIDRNKQSQTSNNEKSNKDMNSSISLQKESGQNKLKRKKFFIIILIAVIILVFYLVLKTKII